MIKLLAVVGAISLAACNGQNGEKIPDTSNIKISIQASRFDKDLYAIDTNHIAEGLQKLSLRYPDFLNFFLDTIMAYGIHGNFTDSNAAIREGLRVFLTYKDFRGLEDTINRHYPDTNDIENKLADGFRFMKYY